jgi:hypothetical protein
MTGKKTPFSIPVFESTLLHWFVTAALGFSIIYPSVGIARSPEQCLAAKSDDSFISVMISVDQAFKNGDAKKVKQITADFLDYPVDIKRLAVGVVLVDRSKTENPLLMRIVGATAMVVANSYGIGQASEFNELFCSGVEEIPQLSLAYEAFEKGNIEGDKEAILVLNEIEESHPLKSFLYARIFLHTYTHRDYFFSRDDQYLELGLNSLIELWETGSMLGAGIFPLHYFFVNRVRSCLSPHKIQMLEDLGIQLSLNTDYLKEENRIVNIAPECHSLIERVKYADKLFALNKANRDQNEYPLGRFGQMVRDVLRGVGTSNAYKNSTATLCKIGRELWFKSAMAGDREAEIGFLEVTSKNDKNKQIAFGSIGRAVPSKDKISSCLQREPKYEIELLNKIYVEGRASDEWMIRLATLLHDAGRITESGFILFELAKKYKASGERSKLFLIYDAMLSQEQLRESIFLKRVESLL